MKNPVRQVLIGGGGVAGLACAKTLSEAGIDFLLLEARDRLGGRVLGTADPEASWTHELGAEFIHGLTPHFQDELQRQRLYYYDASSHRYFLSQNTLKKLPHFFDRIEQLMPGPRKTDISLESYLKSRQKVSSLDKALFRSFVEGYHAADLSKMGVAALRETEEGEETVFNGVGLFRPERPYSEWVKKIVDSSRSNFRLNQAIRRIDVQPDAISLEVEDNVSGGRTTLQARHLVFTLPIGVLKSSDILWNSQPTMVGDLCDSVEMGHVQKLIFRFDQRFWENLTEEPIGFLHASPRCDFSFWWTYHPLRSPHLVAWQGGPQAYLQSQWPLEKRVEAALATLARLTQRSERYLTNHLLEVFTHDWTNDPWSQGAYSYVMKDGLNRLRRHRHWQQGPVVLAGEGVARGSGRGTVHGAFETGVAAAQRVIQSISG